MKIRKQWQGDSDNETELTIRENEEHHEVTMKAIHGLIEINDDLKRKSKDNVRQMQRK